MNCVRLLATFTLFGFVWQAVPIIAGHNVETQQSTHCYTQTGREFTVQPSGRNGGNYHRMERKYGGQRSNSTPGSVICAWETRHGCPRTILAPHSADCDIVALPSIVDPVSWSLYFFKHRLCLSNMTELIQWSTCLLSQLFMFYDHRVSTCVLASFCLLQT